ncbi:OmpA family protein [Pedobacter xixiisoli]|uniref:Tetratricopeptide repeat-containing protein n=1 Tax=Pedobacter xixiisoli TaxID=1476464 RepID=A0A285ZRB1_9SPHI|nr:OmpA family protein [Pedobacter xixiisoli]SOD12170.1 Tetratricopeptide repeat-containing protein [Pedobacter xixiisoli]
MKFLKILIVVLCFANVANAQMGSSNKRIADVYFLNKEYYAAAEYYKRVLQISPDSAGFVIPYGFEQRMKETSPRKDDYEYAVYQLASSLRLYKNFRDAEKWYAVSNKFTNPKYAQSEFWYGECLRANLKYDEAIKSFESFIDKYKVNDDFIAKAKLEIASSKYALYEMRYPRMFKIARLSNNINQAGSNYAPAVSNSELYFTSSRPVGSEGKNQILEGSKGQLRVFKKETPYVNTIYSVAIENPTAEKVNIQKINMDFKKMESAAATVHPNGEMMFLTAWATDKEYQKRNIYISRKEGNGWGAPVSLGGEININGFNSMQPSVTRDGKYLIFSSDRPGGLGGYDLWFATLRSDGSVGSPVNMGEKINTKEDEQAAYYLPATQKLVFSSNGRVGLGGFDFYESVGDFAEWAEPINMGYPFNSAKDDIYFAALDDAGKEAYISSDRESVCCLEVFQVVREYISVQGTILDCATKKPLAGATITAVGTNVPEQVMKTDVNGRYNFQVGSNRDLQINVMKDKYFAKNISYNYAQLFKADTLLSSELCLEPMVINKPIVLKNILYEFNSAELTDSSKKTLDTLFQVMIDNPNIEIELSAHTDNIGSEPYNLDLSDKRAKSCVAYLMSKGITPDRLTSKGYGFSKPVALNQTEGGKKDNPAGRALNRRTEFKVTKQKQIE